MRPAFYLILVIVCVLIAARCATPLKSNDTDTLTGSHVKAQNQTFHWVKQGSGPTAVIAIHGTPGNWEAWQAFMALPETQQQYSVYAIDRPGWGGSALPNDGVIADFDLQQALIHSWYQAHIAPKHHGPVFLVGHSWGATVAAALMAKNPEVYDGAVLIAGPFDPKLNQPRWYHRFAKSRVIQFIIGKELSKSNMEMLPLPDTLKRMASVWQNIQKPVIIVQGKKDWLVPTGNAKYLASKLRNDARHTLAIEEELGHFFVFSKPEIILAYLNEVHQEMN